MSLTPMDVAAEVIAELRATIAERDAEIRRLRGVILANGHTELRDKEALQFECLQALADGNSPQEIAVDTSLTNGTVTKMAGLAAIRFLLSRAAPPDMSALPIGQNGAIGSNGKRAPHLEEQDAALELLVRQGYSGPQAAKARGAAPERAAIRRLWSMQHPEEARARGWPTCYPGEEGGA